MCFVFISNTWVKSITSISHNILDSGFQTVGLAPIKGGGGGGGGGGGKHLLMQKHTGVNKAFASNIHQRRQFD